MIRRDEAMMLDLLEGCLSAIESGASRSDALDHARLEPTARRELGGLLHAADVLRDLPLPQLSAADLAIQRSHLLAAAAEREAAGRRAARRSDAGPFAGRGPWLSLLVLILAGAMLWRFGGVPQLGKSSGDARDARGAQGQVEGGLPTDVRLAPAETAIPTRDLAMATSLAPAGPSDLGAAPDDIAALLAAIGQGLAGPTPSGAALTPLPGPSSSPSSSPTPAPLSPAPRTEEPRSRRTATAIVYPSRSPSPTPTSTLSPTPTPSPRPSETPSPSPSPTLTSSPTPDEPHGEAVLEAQVSETGGGGPIAGAEVVAEREDGGPSVVAETNLVGVARLVLVSGFEYRLRADAAGHQRRWWPNAAERAQSQLIQLAVGQSRRVEMNLPPSLEQAALWSAHALR